MDKKRLDELFAECQRKARDDAMERFEFNQHSFHNEGGVFRGSTAIKFAMEESFRYSDNLIQSFLIELLPEMLQKHYQGQAPSS